MKAGPGVRIPYLLPKLDKDVDMEKLQTITRLGISTTVDSNGQLHSLGDLPSSIDSKGTGYWHNRGVLHREGGPAVDSRHLQMWYRQGKIHRDGDEPAIYEDGGRRVMYYKDDLPHRVFGPAVIEISGAHKIETYWIHGQKYPDRELWERDAVLLRPKEQKKAPKTKVESIIDAIDSIKVERTSTESAVDLVVSAAEQVQSPEAKAPEVVEKKRRTRKKKE